MMLLVSEYRTENATPAPRSPEGRRSNAVDRRLVTLILALFFVIAAARTLVGSPAASHSACMRATDGAGRSAAACAGQSDTSRYPGLHDPR